MQFILQKPRLLSGPMSRLIGTVSLYLPADRSGQTPQPDTGAAIVVGSFTASHHYCITAFTPLHPWIAPPLREKPPSQW